jgi:hypothetical protein
MFALNSESGNIGDLPQQGAANVDEHRDDPVLTGFRVVRSGGPIGNQNMFHRVVSKPKSAEHAKDMQTAGVKRLNVPSENKGKSRLGTSVGPPVTPHRVDDFPPEREQSLLGGALNLTAKSPFRGSRSEDEASLIPNANREVGDAGDARTGRGNTGVLDLSIEAESEVLTLAQRFNNMFLTEVSREVFRKELSSLEVRGSQGALPEVLFLTNDLIIIGSDEISLFKLGVVGQSGPHLTVINEGLGRDARAIMLEDHSPNTVGSIGEQHTETASLNGSIGRVNRVRVGGPDLEVTPLVSIKSSDDVDDDRVHA